MSNKDSSGDLLNSASYTDNDSDNDEEGCRNLIQLLLMSQAVCTSLLCKSTSLNSHKDCVRQPLSLVPFTSKKPRL